MRKWTPPSRLLKRGATLRRCNNKPREKNWMSPRKWKMAETLKTAEVLHVQVEDSVETSSCRGEAKTKPLSKNAKNIMKNTVVLFMNYQKVLTHNQ